MLLAYNITFPNYLRGQDPPFFVNAMLCAGSFYAISKPTYCYRIGHKKVNWNIKKANDRMLAINDVLELSLIHGYSKLYVFTLKEFQSHYCEYIFSGADINNPAFTQLIMKANNYISSDMIKNECSSVILKHIVPYGLLFRNSSGRRFLRQISYVKSKILVYYWEIISLHQRGELMERCRRKLFCRA